LTGTYATSTYLAALKKSPKDLESLAKDVETFDKKIKEDEKVASFIRECGCRMELHHFSRPCCPKTYMDHADNQKTPL
jgi:hypothetical protein